MKTDRANEAERKRLVRKRKRNSTWDIGNFLNGTYYCVLPYTTDKRRSRRDDGNSEEGRKGSPGDGIRRQRIG